MEGLWRMYSYWRKTGCSIATHQAVVHLHFIHDIRLPSYHLYDTGFLDEYETIHLAKQA
jgi:hypothetical protein